MTQFWLIPADEPSYQQTLAQQRDLSSAPKKPKAFPDTARVWGVRTDPEHEDAPWDRNNQNLERMAPGDPLLVYRNSQSQYVVAGRIGGPIWHTKWVRDKLWNGGPALDVFHIDEWSTISLDPEAVNRTIGYKENFVPQGLWRIADNRPTDRLLQRVGLK